MGTEDILVTELRRHTSIMNCIKKPVPCHLSMARQINKSGLKAISQFMKWVYRIYTMFYENCTVVKDSFSTVFVCKTIFDGC